MDVPKFDSIPIGIFDYVPISIIYIGTTLILLLSFEIGYRISKYGVVQKDKEGFNSTSPMVSGLLAMLAFVLGFTFAMASSQHNLRKHHVLNEANVIGTAYLRADLIGKRDGDKIKKLLKEYVDSRVYSIPMADMEIVKRVLKRSSEIHDQLWTQVALSAKNEPTFHVGLLIQSINDIIDSHQNRITSGFYDRIPSSIWIVLLIISSLTMMTMGSQARLSSSRRLSAIIPLIMSFTALTSVVMDLDSPRDGMITVGQEAMIELQKSLKVKPE